MSGFLKIDSAYNHGHWLLVDGVEVQLLECISQKIALGDYGNWDHDNERFRRDGNIFEDIPSLPDQLGIDTENSAHRPVERMISDVNGTDDVVKTFTGLSTIPALVLRRPIGLSLPNSLQLVQLLKTLSTRLADKYLVTTIVLCSAFSTTDSSSERAEKNKPAESRPSGTQSPSTKSRNIAVLYGIAQPQVWRRDTADNERKESFEEIREQFHALLNSVRFPGNHSTAGKSGAEAKKFFSDVFGVEYLRSYVRPPWLLECLTCLPRIEH
ncbi:hypothetical protein BKA82DRAFT_415058 [Pisolithus tinctorius]|uniref:Uncharacterized protein n=1 Tax=Pisolithus tinctorius Marx 270 TaxID=870435 RepID=A0A0C3NDZ6_PISTI|nr:hypothetical protein BKA82DRAFT_415058 [Pisolithus tinctorius]KIN94015.1 hypothetical protein M404DRAFT_415058 [Pisolithus tinctorius Marx 270]